MKAAILSAPNDLKLKDVLDPVMGTGDLLLRIRAATICGTDIRIFRGLKTAGVRYPSIIGHEFAGEVVDAGGHPGVSIGDRVAVCPFIPCSACPTCAKGLDNLCPSGLAVGYEIDGAFAEYIRIPSRAAGNAVHLPDAMCFEDAALLEPLACVLNGQDKVALGQGDRVVVLGGGPIGLMHVALARHRGAERIIACDPNVPRRAAAMAFGAHAAIDPRAEDVPGRVLQETQGQGADVVICAVGTPEVARQALGLAALGGRVLLFAGYPTGTELPLDVNAIHYREISVTGAFGLSPAAFRAAFDLMVSGAVDLRDLITHRLPLDDVEKAFALAEGREALKVAVVSG